MQISIFQIDPGKVTEDKERTAGNEAPEQPSPGCFPSFLLGFTITTRIVIDKGSYLKTTPLHRRK